MLIAILASMLTAGGLWFLNRSVTMQAATWDDVRAEAEQGGYRLILTDELWKYYSAKPESLLMVDTRQEWEYRTGHIKEALNFPIEPTWLSRWRKQSALEAILGPDKNRMIVFY